MKIQLTIDITELLDKSKEIDLAKVMEVYSQLQAGKEVSLLNNALVIKKIKSIKNIKVNQ